jgi:hypothetical protein
MEVAELVVTALVIPEVEIIKLPRPAESFLA